MDRAHHLDELRHVSNCIRESSHWPNLPAGQAEFLKDMADHIQATVTALRTVVPKVAPHRWRKKLAPGTKVCGRTPEYFYGCYYPTTDLNTGESGNRGTGKPDDVEWLDPYGEV